MKKFILILIMFVANYGFSQIRSNGTLGSTINGQSPFIDVSAANFSSSTNSGKGIIFPRTDLTVFTFNPANGNAFSYPTGFDGFIVYNTTAGNTPATGSGIGGQAVTQGFYYFDNTSSTGTTATGTWTPLGGGGTATAGTLIDADSDTHIQVEEGTDDDFIRFDTSGEERAVINAAGNVGIGTADPTNSLHINGANGSGINLSDNANAGNNIALNMYHGGASGKGMGLLWNDTTNSSGAMVIQALNSTGGFVSNLHSFGRDGNVGIGTITPTEKLDVRGEAFLGVMSGYQDTGNLRLGRADNPAIRYHDIQVRNDNTAVGSWMRFRINNGISGTTQHNVMTLTGENRVGIGTTTPQAVLEVSSTNSGLLLPRVANTAAVTTAVNGMLIYDISSECVKSYEDNTWSECLSSPGIVGEIASLDCAGATHNGSVVNGSPLSGVSSVISYTGGNGGIYNAKVVNSTGITGLTATLASGSLTTGNGTLTYTITGTPSGPGTANFAISIAEQACTLSRMVVNPPTPTYCIATSTTIVDVTGNAGKTWMDRNLGATQAATSSTDASAKGDLYQWGRFSDGHQCRNSNTTTTIATSELPGHGDFILKPTVPPNWHTPSINTLWASESSITNPCPSGYRVPTAAEWSAEHAATSSKNAAGALATLKLPYTGYRAGFDGTIKNLNFAGTYQASTLYSLNPTSSSRYFLFTSTTMNSITSSSRNHGLAVRCIKD